MPTGADPPKQAGDPPVGALGDFRGIPELMYSGALTRDEYAQLERDGRRLHAVLPRYVRDDRLRGVERGVMEFLEEAAERVVASGGE